MTGIGMTWRDVECSVVFAASQRDLFLSKVQSFRTKFRRCTGEAVGEACAKALFSKRDYHLGLDLSSARP